MNEVLIPEEFHELPVPLEIPIREKRTPWAHT